MNILSVLSIMIYTAFFIGAWHMLTAERKSVLNRSASAVLLSLGWWSFCNSFFFAAATVQQAWFWHRLSAIGWCGFVALTAYYFLALTNGDQPRVALWKQALFFAPPAVLIVRNLFGRTTSLAQGLVFCNNSWTYENSPSSLWLWIYLLYVALYFGFAFQRLYHWARVTKHKMKQEMAAGFVALDVLTILFGLVTDVVLPLTHPGLPALASIGTALFGIGYFTLIYRHDVFNINLVISPDSILQTSNNAIFVTDENREILKYNHAAGSLLGYGKGELLGVDFLRLAAEAMDFQTLYAGEDLLNCEVKMRCRDGAVKDVLLSASVARDRRHSFLCVIVSCQDVTKQKRVQAELAVERENYKKLAGDYQQLAYYDPLTGLPNRRFFFDTLSEFEVRYHAEQRDFAVIFLDLDNFKHVNDVYGHKRGDELLKAAAEYLRACVDPGEFVARLGGDEFMVILPDSDDACVARKLQRIGDAFHQQIALGGSLYEIGISAGSGVFSQIGDASKLMQLADEAMYRNKNKNSPGDPASL